MSKDYRLYLTDMLDRIIKIEKYVKGYDQEKFEKDEILCDAVQRTLRLSEKRQKKFLRTFGPGAKASTGKRFQG